MVTIPAMPPSRCCDCPLRSLRPFRPFKSDIVADDVQAIRTGTRRTAHGASLFSVGEPVRAAYTLFDGHAIRFRLLASGRRQITALLLPGDLLFPPDTSETAVWPDSVEAVGGAVFCTFPAIALRRLLKQRLEIVQALLQIYTAEEQLLTEHITDLGQRPALDRVARLFLELFHRERMSDRVEENRCFVPFTQEQLGDAVGLRGIHVSRMHAMLRQMSLMNLSGHWLSVPDFDAAARRFDFSPAYIMPRPLL